MLDNLHEECGVFGIFDKSGETDVASMTYMALYALQHRGQESCGIAVNDDGIISLHRDVGLVPDVFNRTILDKLGKGTIAMGHVRYSKAAQADRANAQPLFIRHVKGPMAIGYNGALTNGAELRHELELTGAIFHTTNDAEVIAYKISKARLESKSIEESIEKAMYELKGAYSIIAMSPKKLIAARDENGIRPLCLGKLNDAYVFASESCAFDTIGATFIRDVKPGEIIVIDENGMRTIETHCGKKGNLCVFEYVYFARPDSVIEGSSVHEARLRAGAFLAKAAPVEADVVIGVPDSGLDCALGYARESGIAYGVGFIKNRYVGRTFIQPTQAQRLNAVRIKLNVLAATVKGKRVVLLDDSIVRGTTSARIVNLLREAGATEVHVRISSPPFINPCYFGTDVDSKENLIACRMSIEEIGKEIGADTIAFLSIEDMKKVPGIDDIDFCVGCFTGEYPVPIACQECHDKYSCKIKK
ncbi:MAG: amidophosphoribosyltransferase [Oscillospiraceae bacterium]